VFYVAPSRVRSWRGLFETIKTKINKMDTYQVTIGYRAVIQISVDADNETEAKEIALAEMELVNNRIARKQCVELCDSTYGADGAVNMTKTWDMVQN
jgi:hypothetical protein